MKQLHRSKKYLFLLLGIVFAIGVIHLFEEPVTTNKTVGTIHVVAAENFWGSLVSQLGGNQIQVTTVVSDPNADPHEYESTAATARAFAQAQYVILNGAGYDSWGDKLVSANPSTSRMVLNVATLLGKKNGDNPHFWYNPSYVNTVVAAMEANLRALDPGKARYFTQQEQALQASLAVYQDRITTIKKAFAGTQVAATEDIFQYLATAAGLHLVSPEAFIQAVAEGNDPPTASVVQFQQQLQSGSVKVLVYNEQTVTPLTQRMKALAASENIPIVGITETIQPPDTSFQTWMNGELLNLQNALNAQALGQ